MRTRSSSCFRSSTLGSINVVDGSVTGCSRSVIGEGVTVDICEGVAVDICEGVTVDICEGVTVDICEGVAVDICEGVTVDICEGVTVDICEGVTVDICEGVAVDICEGVTVDICEGVTVDICEGVTVGMLVTPSSSVATSIGVVEMSRLLISSGKIGSSKPKAIPGFTSSVGVLHSESVLLTQRPPLMFQSESLQYTAALIIVYYSVMCAHIHISHPLLMNDYVHNNYDFVTITNQLAIYNKLV